jgi:acetyltransferase
VAAQETLAGCAAAEAQHLAFVRALMVHSRARRRGIGGVLLRAVEAEARALGRGELRLVALAGTGAESLIRDLGYTREGDAASAMAEYTKTLSVPEAA